MILLKPLVNVTPDIGTPSLLRTCISYVQTICFFSLEIRPPHPSIKAKCFFPMVATTVSQIIKGGGPRKLLGRKTNNVSTMELGQGADAGIIND